MKKLTFDFVYKVFKDEGCELLETEYINNSTKMKYMCKCGNESEIKFHKFKRGNKCAKCGGTEKLTFDYVYKVFKDEGCELLETEYINNHTKMQYRCSCGNKSEIKFYSFKHNNRRCAKCGGSERLTYDDVYKSFKDEGCELLETEYVNNRTRMRYRCSCGNESSISYSNFKNFNRRCNECGIAKRTGENHPNFKKDRSRLRRAMYLSFDYKKLHILKDDPNYTSHIQSQKQAKLNPDRWARSEYTVDHIFPRVAFIDNDLDNIHGATLIKEICNLRENLRIISESENQAKSGKYTQEEFLKWFEEKLSEIKK